jgi:EpsI family protein
VAAVIAVWPVAQASLLHGSDRDPLTDVTVAPANGWTAVEPTRVDGWRPDVEGAAREQVLTFAKDGREVTVYLALFRNQRQGSELVSSTNQLVYQDNERWMLVDRRSAVVSDAVGEHRANFGLVRGQGALIGAAHWYWLGSTRTVSSAAAKIDLALDRLLMRGDTSAWVAIATPADESLRDAGPVLEAFVRDMGASLHHGLMELARR